MREIVRILANATTDPDVQVGGLGGNVNLMTVVGNVLNVVFGIVGIIAVIMIIIGGVKYATSQGDSTKVKSAKDTILYAIIGLITSLAAVAIVNFVLGGITGNPNGTA